MKQQFSLWHSAGPAAPPYLPQSVNFTLFLVGRGRRPRRHSAIMRIAGRLFLPLLEGTVKYQMFGQDVVGTFTSGEERNYGSSDGFQGAKVTDTITAIQAGRKPRCGIQAAMGQTICMLAAQESGWPIVDFPASGIRRVELKDGPALVMDGLAEVVGRSFACGRLPESSWAAWVRPAARKVCC